MSRAAAGYPERAVITMSDRRSTMWPTVGEPFEGPASGIARTPVPSDMGVPTQLGRQPGLLSWDDLGLIEQTLLVVASREQTLENACSAWSHSPHLCGDIQRTMVAAQELHRCGLIGFYRVRDGYPDLDADEIGTVLSAACYWESTRLESPGVGLYLTTSGEDVMIEP